MTFVAINVLGVPDGGGEELERRFAARAGAVETAPGFVSFELLRPAEGTEDYLVVTRWSDEDSYRAWLGSRQFQAGHQRQGSPGNGSDGDANPDRRAAANSQIWTFEVVQQA